LRDAIAQRIAPWRDRSGEYVWKDARAKNVDLQTLILSRIPGKVETIAA
jgi:hypothetical protein